ncbi:MAG: bifunctional phosphoribosylaminoimidazolecarboxamide formyltransferase/IMP cyclohydrolase [Clostridia bacterium]
MKRALLSVFDKTNIIETAKSLESLGYEIVSTGGTLTVLKENGVKAISVSDITGFPECLSGRVKTLHPNIHAGILAKRDDATHMQQLKQLNISVIDVVIVNLYPFKQVIMKDSTFDEAVENIDIGGPTMLRAAAKNYNSVYVAVDSEDYPKIIEAIKSGESNIEFKKYLMYKVFAHTAAYDAIISQYLMQKLSIDYPQHMTMTFDKVEDLRYGENPHQSGALYKNAISKPNALVNAVMLNGKQLSYNNINDASGAINLLKEFEKPTAVAVKHANPCAVASDDNILMAYKKAYESDTVSIYGGIVAVNREVDVNTAMEMSKIFLEIIIAPSYTKEALEVLCKKVNLRVLCIKDIEKKCNDIEFKKIDGGIIFQSGDNTLVEEMKTVTQIQPTQQQLDDMVFGMKVVKHCKSNAIAIVSGNVTLGLGIGQTNRIWATKQAIEHSIKDVKGAVLASDAFFPFDDCVEVAGENLISAIVQPGGSKRDSDSIAMADNKGITMVFTNIRHFKH